MTKQAGDAAEDATKKVHKKKDELNLPGQIDDATKKAADKTKEAPKQAGDVSAKAATKVSPNAPHISCMCLVMRLLCRR